MFTDVREVLVPEGYVVYKGCDSSVQVILSEVNPFTYSKLGVITSDRLTCTEDSTFTLFKHVVRP